MKQGPGDPAAALARFFTPAPQGVVGVAVSGGSDSLALLHLMHDYICPDRIHAVTVNHGLRAEAASEADTVARIAASLHIPHTTLRWTGWDGQGNTADQARRARYALMTDWAKAQGIAQIALGHTADDLAETLLMRLSRGAGSEGLSAMADRRDLDGVTYLRPLLSVRRTALRDLLTNRGQSWIDDPTNDDTRYDRPRLRHALPDLAALGLTVDALATSARNLRAASDALSHYAAQEARAHVRTEAGDILIPQTALTDMPAEIARRIIQAALRWIAGGDYPPRSAALDRFIAATLAGETMPLAGCIATVSQGTIRLTREPAAVANLTAQPTTLWDDRWQIQGPFQAGDHIAATGEAGLAQVPDWRDRGLPRTTLLSAPAVWRGDMLIAAPLADDATEFRLKLIKSEEVFHATFRTH